MFGPERQQKTLPLKVFNEFTEIICRLKCLQSRCWCYSSSSATMNYPNEKLLWSRNFLEVWQQLFLLLFIKLWIQIRPNKKTILNKPDVIMLEITGRQLFRGGSVVRSIWNNFIVVLPYLSSHICSFAGTQWTPPASARALLQSAKELKNVANCPKNGFMSFHIFLWVFIWIYVVMAQ